MTGHFGMIMLGRTRFHRMRRAYSLLGMCASFYAVLQGPLFAPFLSSCNNEFLYAEMNGFYTADSAQYRHK